MTGFNAAILFLGQRCFSQFHGVGRSGIRHYAKQAQSQQDVLLYEAPVSSFHKWIPPLSAGLGVFWIGFGSLSFDVMKEHDEETGEMRPAPLWQRSLSAVGFATLGVVSALGGYMVANRYVLRLALHSTNKMNITTLNYFSLNGTVERRLPVSDLSLSAVSENNRWLPVRAKGDSTYYILHPKGTYPDWPRLYSLLRDSSRTVARKVENVKSKPARTRREKLMRKGANASKP